MTSKTDDMRIALNELKEKLLNECKLQVPSNQKKDKFEHRR